MRKIALILMPILVHFYFAVLCSIILCSIRETVSTQYERSCIYTLKVSLLPYRDGRTFSLKQVMITLQRMAK